MNRLVAAAALALLAALANPAHADRARWSGGDMQSTFAPHSTADQRRISLDQAVDSVQRATGGKVLDAREADGQYRIKVLTRRGEVRVVYVDPRTGAMR